MSTTLRSFLHRLHEIVERLEYADELDGHDPDDHAQQEPRPPIDPDSLGPERSRFRHERVGVDRLLCDAMAEFRQAGRSGAKIFSQAEGVWGRLKTCAQAHDEGGDLEPWRVARGCIANDLDALRRLLQPQLNVTGVTEPAPPSAVIGKGRTEGGDSILPEIPWNATRVLELLLRDGAIKQGDRLTRQYIAEETRLSSAQIRRAIENDLKPRSLVCSKPGRDGGVWMSTEGIAVAKRTAAGNRRA